MKKKQLIAAIVAAVLFVFIAGSSMGMNILDKAVNAKAAVQAENFLEGSSVPLPLTGEYVGIVKIDGTMQPSVDTGYFSTTVAGYDHDYLVNYLEELSAAPNNVGILLYVDSPGGYSYIGDELYCELMEYKEETGRPIYCYFDSMAASAAYYAAMSADEIYAHRMTTTGAIGVYMTVYDMSELYEKLGIKEIIIKSGENKGMGSYGQEFTAEQQAIEQAQVDEMYNLFVDIVAQGRNMDRDKVLSLADGRTYSAQQALDNGLIDGVARYEEYQKQVLTYFDDGVTYYEPTVTVSPFASLFGAMEELVPKSEEQIIFDFIERNESGVPNYESSY